MNLVTEGDITTRKDGLPYDVRRVSVGVYELRAVGNPSKPVVLVTTGYTEALTLLALQAGEEA